MAGILDAHPEYRDTALLDELRESEYGYLDAQDHVYLDYTGAGLAARAQHRAHDARLASSVFGNPHSVNPTSAAATQAVEQARARILAHLNASPDEYAVIFTANATGAARIVGEAYPFSRNSRLVLTVDNHNSLNGLREFARAAGAKTVYIPSRPADLRVDVANVVAALPQKKGLLHQLSKAAAGMCFPCSRPDETQNHSPHPEAKGQPHEPQQPKHAGRNGLFAYPAQSNFSGVRHPLDWVSLAQQRGYDVLLDAAAYLPTASLDLSTVHPDFVLVSWYKVFGYPTGVGCLVARRPALARLRRPWFSGGSITAVAVGLPLHRMADGGEAFEDGTLNFLAIPDVHFGLDWLAGLGGPSLVGKRVRCLTAWFLERLHRLRHSDGSAMARVYGPADTRMRGATVAFDFIDAAGAVVDERLVALESSTARISLRTGCFCNPGAGEAVFGLRATDLRNLFRARAGAAVIDEVALDRHRSLGIPSVGAVRVSFGLASTAADVDRFLGFAEKTYKDRVTSSCGLPPRTGC